MSEDTRTLHWWALLVGAAIVIGYEAWVTWVGRRHPARVARLAHARMRAEWVRALGQQAGSEIVAVQTLRNSLMSATITASTAALCLMGVVSIAGNRLLGGVLSFHGEGPLAIHLLDLALLVTLFASFVCSAFSMRYYNHAGYVVSMPVGSAAREQHAGLAVRYVEKAGYLYGWGLRCFLLAAPLMAGIVDPLLMPAASGALVLVLWMFDRPAALDTP